MQPRRIAACDTLRVRGLDMTVRRWRGRADAPILVLLHGFADASISFQFLVDALADDWNVVAPDWRGHGLSEWSAGGYWFADYLADLDALLDAVSPHGPVLLGGHSMGGNITGLYAALRPARVLRAFSLDGFSLPDRAPDEAPAQMLKWLDARRDPPTLSPMADLAAVAARLQKINPKLAADKAAFLAPHLAREEADAWQWRLDPRHKEPFPTLHRLEETKAFWRRVEAPMLWIGSGRPFPPGIAAGGDSIESRMACFAQGAYVMIPDTGHNLHHDAPDAVAAVLEPFLRNGQLP